MSTDRELLEDAAKAANLDTLFEMYGWDEIGDGAFMDGNEPPTVWNPLESDADAFRLAVSLKIDISWDAFQDADVMVSHDDQWWTWPYGEDRAAALRLAIVRAAAALART